MMLTHTMGHYSQRKRAMETQNYSAESLKHAEVKDVWITQDYTPHESIYMKPRNRHNESTLTGSGYLGLRWD